jgi:hypothetical protein
MPNTKLLVSTESLQYQVRQTVGSLYSGAERIKLVAFALQDTVGEVFASAESEELRQVAAAVKSHAMTVAISAARLANKAERLETLADVRDAAEPETPGHEG